MTPSFKEKSQQIAMLLLDVDGVLTDGGIFLGSQNMELKRFHVQDGMGVFLARQAGLKVGIITGRASEAVSRRARELNMDELIQGSKDKVSALDDICSKHKLERHQVAYMGDDLQDLGILMACGLSFTPQNGRPELKSRVDLVTQASGGNGAVREAIEALLEGKGLWQQAQERFGCRS